MTLESIELHKSKSNNLNRVTLAVFQPRQDYDQETYRRDVNMEIFIVIMCVGVLVSACFLMSRGDD